MVGLDILLVGARRNVVECVQVDRGGCVRRGPYVSSHGLRLRLLLVDAHGLPAMWSRVKRHTRSVFVCCGDSDLRELFFCFVLFKTRYRFPHQRLDPHTHTAAAELVPCGLTQRSFCAGTQ